MTTYFNTRVALNDYCSMFQSNRYHFNTYEERLSTCTELFNLAEECGEQKLKQMMAHIAYNDAIEWENE